MGIIILYICETLDDLRFQMLQAWMANPNLGDIDVEERYKAMSSEVRTDRYATAPCSIIRKTCLLTKTTYGYGSL